MIYTYQIFKSGNFAGLAMAGRIASKSSRIHGLEDFRGSHRDSAKELNARQKLLTDRVEVVFSTQDIPQDEFLFYVWDPQDEAFDRVSVVQEANIVTFIANAKQMWRDRRQKIPQLRQQIVQEANWANLTPQHKKVLLGATWEHFTESDWDALGLNDSGYVGDHNYSLNKWKQIWKLIK